MPATREDLNAVMASDAFTEAEKRVLAYQFGLDKTGFYHALMEAIFRADYDNQTRMRQAFPDEVDAVRSFQYGSACRGLSLADMFRKAGIEI